MLRIGSERRSGPLEHPLPTVEWLGHSIRTADEVATFRPEQDRRSTERQMAASFLATYLGDRREAPARVE